MFNLKEKLNKFNILVAAIALLSATVIGQSIYIAKLYGKNSDAAVNPKESIQLTEKTPAINKPRSIFDDFDNRFMSNHFKEFRKIKEHMDKVFDDAFSEFNVRSGFDNDIENIFGSSKLTNNLNLNLEDETDKFTITLKLPNTHKNNIDVKLDGQRLVVSGDMKEQIEESSDYGKQYREYSSKFTRSMILPKKVKENTLSTKFEKDKLVITILKEDTA